MSFEKKQKHFFVETAINGEKAGHPGFKKSGFVRGSRRSFFGRRFLPSGFSVIELLVSIAIMGVVMALVLANYPEFNRQLYMNQAARALAYGLREAQSRSVNVNQVECVPAPCFPENFGLHVESAGNNDRYILFTDRNNNKIFDVGGGTCGGASDECVTTTLFTNGIHIQELQKPCAGAPPTKFDILFYRPDPTIKVYDGSGGDLGFCGVNPVNGPFRIFLAPKNVASCVTPGVCKVVRVWLTGQISIEQ